MFNNLLKIDEAGNVFSEWVEWKHVTAGFLHCSTCLSLHKCWFHRKKMPICKQHEHCHCYVFSINSPIPNVNSKAECSIDKFTGYIFSEKYKWNGKMELFFYFTGDCFFDHGPKFTGSIYYHGTLFAYVIDI